MGSSFQLLNADTSDVIVPQLRLANTFWKRFAGLQFRVPLAPDEGLLLTPCSSIHTHWMRFAIDAAMLDENGVVLEIISNLKPWRIPRRTKGTKSVLETTAGVLSGHLAVGMKTKVEER